MPEFEVKLNQPEVGEKIEMTISGIAGFKLAGSTHDKVGHRFVIAFFEEAPDSKNSSAVIEFDIMENEEGELHSVHAIAIVNKQVVGRDRKRVRSGQSEA